MSKKKKQITSSLICRWFCILMVSWTLPHLNLLKWKMFPPSQPNPRSAWAMWCEPGIPRQKGKRPAEQKPQQQHLEQPENRKNREQNNEEKCLARDECQHTRVFPLKGVLVIPISGERDRLIGEKCISPTNKTPWIPHFLSLIGLDSVCFSLRIARTCLGSNSQSATGIPQSIISKPRPMSGW